IKRCVILLALVMSVPACTQFLGSAKVPNGPTGCRAICQELGMNLAGMVVMGEYSDGCICQVHETPVSVREAATAALSAVVGVVEQQRRAAAAGASSSVHH